MNTILITAGMAVITLVVTPTAARNVEESTFATPDLPVHARRIGGLMDRIVIMPSGGDDQFSVLAQGCAEDCMGSGDDGLAVGFVGWVGDLGLVCRVEGQDRDM